MNVFRKFDYLRLISKLLFLLVFVVQFSGCAIPKVVLDPDAKIDKSNKIIFLATGKDPRKVFPRVVSRLEGLGFDVRIAEDVKSIQGGQGTGFIVDVEGYIITSAHIFNDENIASVWIKGKRYDASVINKDKQLDLALLKIIKNKKVVFQPLYISTEPEYRMGNDVYTLGFPLSDILGNSPRLNKGLVSSIVGLKDDPNQVQISAEIQPGNSGGPLLNTSGEVIGVVQSTLNPINVLNKTGNNLPQNVNFATKVNSIESFIRGTGVHINLTDKNKQRINFDKVSESVVQIRAGKITEKDLSQTKVICTVTYVVHWDLWSKFRLFNIDFYDLETGKRIMRAGQYGESFFGTEDSVIDETFKKIEKELFNVNVREVKDNRSPVGVIDLVN